MLNKHPFMKYGLYLIGAFLFASIVQMLINSGTLSSYVAMVITYMCISVIAAVSLNLVLGITGQFSIGHAGFMAIGGYFSAIITKTSLFGIVDRAVFPDIILFIIALLIGGIIAAFAGFLIGMPTLRLRGDYLGIATLGFGEIIRVLFLNWQFVGGAAGYSGVPRMSTFVWAFTLAALTVIVIKNYINSSHGRACKSIREDEIAAETMGINTTKYKVTAFVIGAFFAGISGALLVHMLRLAHPTMFTFMLSVEVLLMVVLGGLGSISGSIAAAVFLTFFSEWFRDFGAVRMIFYSLLMVLIMLFRPKGLLGSKEISVSLVRQGFNDLREFPDRIKKRFSKNTENGKGVS
jgi:branched-chain amino acid transport system permease protein